ncbi:hypothetical protein [Halomicrococcus sp. NG-SE-24]|uniref:hypothetical protein n=1 Tax=Halomicrococcus sp. NG-SE-24 TaxID=3436928 RepID=UPI003D9918A7
MRRRDVLKAAAPVAVVAGSRLYAASTKSTDLHVTNETAVDRALSVSIRRTDGGTASYAEEFALLPNEEVTEEDVLDNGEYNLSIENESTRLETEFSNEFCWDPVIHVAVYDGGGISLSSSRCWLDYVRADR